MKPPKLIASLLVVLTILLGQSRADTVWRPLRIGAGGWLTGIDISPDGSTRLVRTDTYGAYLWSASRLQWEQLVSSSSMPISDVGLDRNAGVYEIRSAPSLPSRLFMAYRGYIFRSDNRGAKWKRTNFERVAMDANDDFRTFGQKMAIDPSNPDIVYFGAPENGLYVTTDGGETWSRVADVPISAAQKPGKFPGISGIAFDPSVGMVSGRTRIIFAASYGNGVFQSADGGASWTHLIGGPASVSHGKVATDGVYYVSGDDNHAVWRYAAGGWTNITPDENVWETIVPDPQNPARIVAVRSGGFLDISDDRGNSWGGIVWGKGANVRVAEDIPWLAWTNESYMSTGDMIFDPKAPGRIWFAEGIGVWRTDLPRNSMPTSVTFISQSKGIEQLVANAIIAPPGGKPVAASWDRPVFHIANPEKFPASHGPDNEKAIVMGWDLDYASSRPATIVGLMNWWGVEKTSRSDDGGRTWRPFPSYPPFVADNKIGGGIAASSPENIVWAPSNNGSPYFTADGGETWSRAEIPGVPTSGNTGWGYAFFLNRHIVAADRVKPATFYLFNTPKGLFRSEDGGASWALVHPGEIAPFSGSNAELRAAPGRAGHLFFTAGPQSVPGGGHPASNPFMRSLDGGETWSAVPDVLEVRAFGFGANDGDYPAIYICGWVKRVYGVWRSDDNARSWTRIAQYPLDSLDDIKTIDGDKIVRGTVYVGFAGSGYAYGVAEDGNRANTGE